MWLAGPRPAHWLAHDQDHLGLGRDAHEPHAACCPMLACGDRLSPNVVFQSAVEIRNSNIVASIRAGVGLATVQP